MPELPDVETLASEFAIVIREWHTPEQCAEMDRRNAIEPYADVCHTHDFCDANMAMAEAFERFGIEVDIQCEDQRRLWCDAWSAAKRSGFSYGQ